MPHSINKGIVDALEQTLPRLEETRNYVVKNYNRAKVVLGKKRLNEMEKNIQHSLLDMGETIFHQGPNADEFYTPNAFENLPEIIQVKRLNGLNKIISFVLAGEDSTGKDKIIHKRFRALHQELKNFQREEKTTERFKMEGLSITQHDGNILPDAKPEMVCRYAIGMNI